MEDVTLRYYEAEMRYLREAAKEFASVHPDRAAMLDLDKVGTPDPLDIEVVLNEQWSADLSLPTDALRLHCVPVINLFSVDADPLLVSGLETEYLLRPQRIQDGYTKIYSVDTVAGNGADGEITYVPFTSFRHQGGIQRNNAPERYYYTRVRRGASGLHDTWLILGGQHWSGQNFHTETASLKITRTNGQLPRRALQSTLLDRCEKVLQTPLNVRNLCKPTLPAWPPREDQFHWRILSHLGTSFMNMMGSEQVLRDTLQLYNWQDDEMHHRRINAIQQVRHYQIQRFEKGFLLRGIDIEITLDSNGFSG